MAWQYCPDLVPTLARQCLNYAWTGDLDRSLVFKVKFLCETKQAQRFSCMAGCVWHHQAVRELGHRQFCPFVPSAALTAPTAAGCRERKTFLPAKFLLQN